MKRLTMVCFLVVLASVATAVLLKTYLFQTGSQWATETESSVRCPECDAICPDCNVVLISIDTLRADRLGIYGYYRNTSPNMDAYFGTGIVFRNAFSQSFNTLPSHMSIFTSQYPPTHKVIHIFENGLDNGTWTLPQVLKLYGYRAAWFAPTEDPHLDPALGFGRGFDVTQPVDLRNPADKERIFDWIRSEPDQKFFLFLHTYAVHEPYVPSAPYDKMFDPDYNGSIVGEKSQYYTLLDEYLKENNLTNIAYTDIESYRKTENITLTVYWARANLSSPRDVYHLSALYDGEIRNLDANFSDFIGFFSSPDIRRKTIVIITADHGEEFGEHGQFHHTDLHNEVLHVPLVIIAPGIGNGSVDPQVQSIDIAPTVLDMLGIQAPHGFQGKSLLPLIKGQIGQLDPYTYAYHYGTASVRSEKWKYIAENFDTRTASYLYDVSVDPRETINLADSNPDTAFMMKGILKKWMTENAANSSQVVNWGPMIGYP